MSCHECGSYCDAECCDETFRRIDLLEAFVKAQNKYRWCVNRYGTQSKRTAKALIAATEAQSQLDWLELLRFDQ